MRSHKCCSISSSAAFSGSSSSPSSVRGESVIPELDDVTFQSSPLGDTVSSQSRFRDIIGSNFGMGHANYTAIKLN